MKSKMHALKLGMVLFIAAIILTGCKTEQTDEEIAGVSQNQMSDESIFNTFIPVDKQPEIIKRVSPEYPELAKTKQLEGTVYVKAIVDRSGKVRKVKVIKSDNDIFIQPSLDAAKKFVFKPAIRDDKAVEVAVVIPFKYKLSAKDK